MNSKIKRTSSTSALALSFKCFSCPCQVFFFRARMECVGAHAQTGALIDAIYITLGCCRRYQVAALPPASLTQSTRLCCPAPTPMTCPSFA